MSALPPLPVDPDAPDRVTPRRWDTALVVAAGGMLGGGLRAWLNELWPTAPGAWPWTTFAENVVGSFALAVLMVLVVDVWRPHRYVRPFLGVGLLGGFTTFSTYAADTWRLLRDGRPAAALLVAVGTVAVCLLATAGGLAVARHRVRA